MMGNKELIAALRVQMAIANNGPCDALMAQAAQALEAQEWRDIDSAPKDGSNVLLWCPRPKTELPPFQITGYWDTEINYDGHQWVSTTHDNIYQPTHWKPLTPPETE